MPGRTDLCPYCGLRPRNSDEHIFPEFMGGKTTIRTCKPCNDVFGHDFEGPVSNDFAPTVVVLRRGGIRSPRRVVWKHAIKRDEVDYDLDSDLQMTPSDPLIVRGEQGSIKKATFANSRAARSFIRGQEALGKKLELTPETIKGIDIRESRFSLEAGTEVRRLAVKIAIASSDKMGLSNGLADSQAKEFLLGCIQQTNRVRIDFVVHEAIEKLRPPLSHFVFVKGNGKTHNIYAIVQFYGLMQFWVLLNEGGFAGDDFAIAAVLDVAKGYRERFEQTEFLMLPVPPINMALADAHKLQLEWMKKWNMEAGAVLEDNGKIVNLDLSNISRK